jgi:hypothetical protein
MGGSAGWFNVTLAEVVIAMGDDVIAGLVGRDESMCIGLGGWDPGIISKSGRHGSTGVGLGGSDTVSSESGDRGGDEIWPIAASVETFTIVAGRTGS